MRALISVRDLAPLLALLLAGCGGLTQETAGSSATPSAKSAITPGATVAELRQRPIKLPTVASRSACPVSASHNVHAVINDPKGGAGFGYGNGPVYAGGFVDLYPGGFDNEVWLIDASYRGPVLVRGRQVNGQQAVRFAQPITFPQSAFLPAGPPPGTPLTTLQIGGDGVPFYGELDLPAASANSDPHVWREFFGRTHIDAPGCYGFQIDGLSFSDTLIFHVSEAARQGG
jgi:hypothetical protein